MQSLKGWGRAVLFAGWILMAPMVARGAVPMLAAGPNHVCALNSSGNVLCWGDNSWGELGIPATVTGASAAPVVVPGPSGSGMLAGIAAISAGGGSNGSVGHNCALTSAGTVMCWGANNAGQLGNNTISQSVSTPAAVVGVGGTGVLSGVTAVAAGSVHTCALTSAGTVLCWGNNGSGALGNPGASSSSPVPVQGLGGTGLLGGVTAIASGYERTCALLNTGNVACWGANDFLALGQGSATLTTSNLPLLVVSTTGSGTLGGIKAIAAGSQHTCALQTSGGVVCWGDDTVGQLGALPAGLYPDSGTPLVVEGSNGSGTLGGVAALAGSASGMCALFPAGTVQCWGAFNLVAPKSVPGVGGSGVLGGVVSVIGNGSSEGFDSACAVLSDGTVPCWSGASSWIPVQEAGSGGYGLLNLLATISNPTPQRSYVSLAGSDANNCGPTAPCRTWQAALAQTAPGGEILTLDSGGFGTLVIGKSVTLVVPPGVYGGMSPPAGVDGVMIQAAGARVVLKGLTIAGQGGTSGIHLVDAAEVSVENTTIEGMGTGILATCPAALLVRDSRIRANGGAGIALSPAVQTCSDFNVMLAQVQGSSVSYNGSDGIQLGDNVALDLSGSDVAGNGTSGTGWGLNAQATLSALDNVPPTDIAIDARDSVFAFNASGGLLINDASGAAAGSGNALATLRHDDLVGGAACLSVGGTAGAMLSRNTLSACATGVLVPTGTALTLNAMSNAINAGSASTSIAGTLNAPLSAAAPY